MPRRDKTFHGGDIIRLLAKNLNSKEQDDVILFLYLVIPEIASTRIEDRIFGPVPPVPSLSRSLLSLILRALSLLRLIPFRIRSIVVNVFLSDEARKEVTRATALLTGRTFGPPFRMRRR